MYKVAIVLAFAAVASAGNVAYLDTHVGSQVEQTVRGFGGLSSLSHQAKTVNSAYSTSSAYKTKATNSAYPAVYQQAYAQPAVAYAQPAVAYAQAAPVAVAHAPVAYAHAAPVAYAAQQAYAPSYAVAHAAPVLRAAPVAVAHAPVGVTTGGLLGVKYSPVTAGVATLSFDGFGVHYGY